MEQEGAVWTRTSKDRESWRDDIVEQEGAVWTRAEKVGEMTLWNKRERYGQGRRKLER